MPAASDAAPLATDGPTASPSARISAGRAHIDALDGDILALVAARSDHSRAIQAARRDAGGGTVEPGREAVVTARYVDALGPHGADVAAAVLQVCRGPLPRH